MCARGGTAARRSASAATRKDVTRERAVGRRRLGAQSGDDGASGGQARRRLEEARVFVRHLFSAGIHTPIGLLWQARGADDLFRPWSDLRVGSYMKASIWPCSMNTTTKAGSAAPTSSPMAPSLTTPTTRRAPLQLQE